MMNSSISIFAVPSASLNLLHKQPNLDRKKKRKRNGQGPEPRSPPQSEDNLESHSGRDNSIEYSAVVTPAERSQRRLAGLSLDKEPPPFPFPHAAVSSTKSRENFRAIPNRDVETLEQSSQVHVSLRAQHLAAVTALLHRCMMTRDYSHARRALGLILRSEVGGRAVDIRSEGLWGIGAEILFRQRDNSLPQDGSVEIQEDSITREGLERAKSYYELLMLQYPQHRTWPDAVNELDFGIAMFGLWVYVTDQESQRLQQDLRTEEDEDVSAESVGLDMREAKLWELKQAKQIAEAMDLRMSSVLYNEASEFVRLRAMVSLWIADLIETRAELETGYEGLEQPYERIQEDDISNQVEHLSIHRSSSVQTPSDLSDVTRNRELARTLFGKLKD